MIVVQITDQSNPVIAAAMTIEHKKKKTGIPIINWNSEVCVPRVTIQKQIAVNIINAVKVSLAPAKAPATKVSNKIKMAIILCPNLQLF